jgi:uncharacterized protein with GYD domain
MTTYVLLSKVAAGTSSEVRSLRERVRAFKQRLAERYPQVTDLTSYALLGSYDFLYIFEAPDANTATKVALLAQAFGAATTETLTAIPLDEFSAMLDDV